MGKITEAAQEKRTDRRYWLYEEPEIFETSKNAIRYYKEAGKIQFACPDYVEAHFDNFFQKMIEERKPGRLCALDLTSLYEDPATLSWLISILEGSRQP